MGLLESAITGKRRSSSHAHVVAELGSSIVAGTIAVGTILPGDNELTQRFNVSRTVLREAMKTLAAKGLIEPKAKVGTRVLPSDKWNFFDPDVLGWRFEAGVDQTFTDYLAEIRLALEPAAGAAPALTAPSEHILALDSVAAHFLDN